MNTQRIKRGFIFRMAALLLAVCCCLLQGCKLSSGPKGDLPSSATFRLTPGSYNLESTGTGFTFTITNDSQEALVWTISDNQDWLVVAPITDATAQDSESIVSVTIDRGCLKAGQHQGIITVSSVSSGKEKITLQVTMKVDPQLSVATSTLDFGDSLTN